MLGRYYTSHNRGIARQLPEGAKEAIAEFNQVLSDHPDPFEDVPSLCGATRADSIQIAARDRYGFELETWLSKRSGLLWTTPRYRPEVLDTFYGGYFQRIYRGPEDVISMRFVSQVRRSQRILRAVQKSLGRERLDDLCVIDIGCSAGGMLLLFEELGASVLGYDIGGEQYLEYGRRRGLDLRQGSAADMAQTERPDVVFLSHVLEHTPDPLATLRDIWTALPEGGLAAIEVPGVFTIESKYKGDPLRFLQNAHLWHFTSKTLSACMRAAGFEVVSSDESVICVGRKVAAASSPLESTPGHATEVLEYLRSLERKRKARVITRRVRKKLGL